MGCLPQILLDLLLNTLAQMKPNTEKCQLLINKECRKKMNIANNIITKSKCEKLRIKFDKKLNFEANVGDLDKKASRKMHALARITSYMSFSKK